ncbi:hypothetical protein [Nitrolancea hollandica]|uniref:Uncharacterized protein n=1 Tax=Nitrolancea hollandica Lb TaxID=1129897 RepID=I4EJN7_9BACT|nr:hypothetical protein [Nitrolancea hollandica]CCF84899.1 exported hypothetical protein [Nitrolancea hollandica Lb]
MIKRVMPFVIAFLLVGLIVFPAQAGLIWCQGDPVVSLNGTEVQIVVSIPEDKQQLVTGPIEVDIATPNSVNREVISTDDGFNGYGETVSFSNLKTPAIGNLFITQISAHIPVSSNGSAIPVQMTITPSNGRTMTVRGTADGTNAVLLVHGSA